MHNMNWACLEQVSLKEMMQLNLYSKFKEINMREGKLEVDGNILDRKLTPLMKKEGDPDIG